MENMTINKLCYICEKPGHKARRCILNKKSNMNRMFREPYADALASPVYDSHRRSHSPIVRSSRDFESTQSVNNITLTERDLKSEVVKTSAVIYIGNIPNDWEYKDLKLIILNKMKWHTPKIDTNLKVIILKGKYHKPSCKVAKVILDDQEFAKIIVEWLTNEECNGNKLEVTQDPEAPFLKDIDTNTIDKENEINSRMYEKRNKSRLSNFQADHGPTLDHIFKREENEDNLYGLSREYLSCLGITPPLHSSIFVAGFDPVKVDKEKLHQVFSLAGQVVTIHIFRNNEGAPKKCAIITFDHPIEAVQAISMFRDQSLYGDNLTINLSTKPKLPEGLQQLGPGLGPGGKPMRNVRATIELEPLKHLLHKKLTKKKADSPTNLEKYGFHDAFFQQNVPTIDDSNQTTLDSMTLNSAMNTIIQNAAMSIMAQNSVMNPAMSVMTQNAAMNHMIQNAAMNPMIQNTVMNSIAQNAGMTPMIHNPSVNSMSVNMNQITQNTGMNPVIHDPSVNSMSVNMNEITQNTSINPMMHNPTLNSMSVNMNQITQNTDMNPMIHNFSVNTMAQNVDMNQTIQNTGMNPMIHNPSVNTMAQNANINPTPQNAGINQITQNAGVNQITQNADVNQITQNAGLNRITQNADMNPVAQNVGTNPIAQNAVIVNPMAQNYAMATNSVNSPMQNYAQQNKSCDSEGKDDTEKENGSHIVVITNLPSSVDQRGLKLKMREIGKTVFVKLMTHGRAIVSYEKYKDALKCISIFHKCKVDGEVIEVKLL